MCLWAEMCKQRKVVHIFLNEHMVLKSFTWKVAYNFKIKPYKNLFSFTQFIIVVLEPQNSYSGCIILKMIMRTSTKFIKYILSDTKAVQKLNFHDSINF